MLIAGHWPEVVHRHRPERPDPAILEIVRALARLAAREDHQRDRMEREHEARSDLRQVFD
jgi:hypothetical protein